MKNTKGFTLIELLAVIVVLAIVMVLAVTTVLPYMEDAKKEAFATEATSLKKAAKTLIELVNLGEDIENVEKYYNKDDEYIGYCIDLYVLQDAGLYEKHDDNYNGKVLVKDNGGTYQYFVTLTNGDYYIHGTSFSKDYVADSNDDAKNLVEGSSKDLEFSLEDSWKYSENCMHYFEGGTITPMVPTPGTVPTPVVPSIPEGEE